MTSEWEGQSVPIAHLPLAEGQLEHLTLDPELE